MKFWQGSCIWFHRLALVAISTGVLTLTPAIAAINCTGNLSATEAIICKDSWLQELDQRLNMAYSKAIKVAIDKQALIRDQRKWLHETRDRCVERNCINLAYLPRIERLETSYKVNKDLHLAIAQGINESNLSSQESKTTCAKLSKLADDGHITSLIVHGHEQGNLDSQNVEEGWFFTNDDKKALRARKSLFVYGEDVKTIYKLKLTKNGAPVRFARFYQSGAEQSSWRIFNLSIILNPEDQDNGIDKVAGLDVDDTRWAEGLDSPIFYNGRYFIFSTSDVASMISWVRPNGRIRPLCFWDKEGTRLP